MDGPCCMMSVQNLEDAIDSSIENVRRVLSPQARMNHTQKTPSPHYHMHTLLHVSGVLNAVLVLGGHCPFSRHTSIHSYPAGIILSTQFRTLVLLFSSLHVPRYPFYGYVMFFLQSF